LDGRLKKDYAFTVDGYANWKAAPNKDKGLAKNASSMTHSQLPYGKSLSDVHYG